jgi:DNA (cytosine-5)-methyltransferase 1
MEAASAAVERMELGWEPVAFGEINPAACAVLAHRWPHVPNLGDITKVDWSRFAGQVDIVVGGPPCQDFSTAGQRAGIGGARGNLSMEYLHVLEAIRPRWAVLENVANLLHSNGGRDFGALLGRLDDIGFDAAWAVLDGLDFGLPARRKRLWLVGHRRDGRDTAAGQILAVEPSPGRDVLKGCEAWKRPATRVRGRELVADPHLHDTHDAWGNEIVVDYDDEPIFSYEVYDQRGRGDGETVPTLMRESLHHPTDYGPILFTKMTAGGFTAARRFTPRECLRLQGFDDAWLDDITLRGKLLSDQAKYRMIGNSWAVPCAAWVLERIDAMDRMLAVGEAPGFLRAA